MPDSSVEQLDEGHLRYRESGKTLTVPIRFDAQIMGQPCAQIHLASLRRWDPPNANLELTVAEIDRVNNRLTLFVFEQRGYGLVLQKQ